MATAKPKYKLKKNANGKVGFLLRSDNDFVRNETSLASAQHIIDNGRLKLSHIEGYPINVDNKWYFEGEIVSEATENLARGDEK